MSDEISGGKQKGEDIQRVKEGQVHPRALLPCPITYLGLLDSPRSPFSLLGRGSRTDHSCHWPLGQ